jgi:uncharacterized membrane protein YfcA
VGRSEFDTVERQESTDDGLRPNRGRQMAQARRARVQGDRVDVLVWRVLGLPAALAALVGVPSLLIAGLLPAAQVVPVFSLVTLASAALVAWLAWRRQTERDMDRITLWDVAGALAFIGCAAGMLSQSAQVARLFGLAITAS